MKDYNHTDMTVYLLYGPATGNSLLETASSPRGVISFSHVHPVMFVHLDVK